MNAHSNVRTILESNERVVDENWEEILRYFLSKTFANSDDCSIENFAYRFFRDVYSTFGCCFFRESFDQYSIE